jgi:putative acetyltransferase
MTAVREMRPADARAFLEVHHAAVRGLAAKDYPQAVIEDWAPLPLTDKVVERFLLNPDNEIRLVAEHDGKIVGIGAIVVDKAELRACYVTPEASRKGVGSALVREIERIAQQRGLGFLVLDSSMTAEPFYLAQGYAVLEQGVHILRAGQAMACVKMVKTLQPRAQHLSALINSSAP